jgi:hypothetical protein
MFAPSGGPRKTAAGLNPAARYFTSSYRRRLNGFVAVPAAAKTLVR